MIWTLVIIILSASNYPHDLLPSDDWYHVKKEKGRKFSSFIECNAEAEAYSAANQVFVPAYGPPWVYSYAVCEEGMQ
jgi:hypothetical protein